MLQTKFNYLRNCCLLAICFLAFHSCSDSPEKGMKPAETDNDEVTQAKSQEGYNYSWEDTGDLRRIIDDANQDNEYDFNGEITAGGGGDVYGTFGKYTGDTDDNPTSGHHCDPAEMVCYIVIKGSLTDEDGQDVLNDTLDQLIKAEPQWPEPVFATDITQDTVGNSDTLEVTYEQVQL